MDSKREGATEDLMLLSTIGFFDSYYYAIEFSFRFGGAFMELRPDHPCT